MSARCAFHGAALAWTLAAVLAGCGREGDSAPGARAVLDAERGRVAVREYGCGACHAIPGVPGADGRVGPPLERIATRAYIAGVLPNTRANMERWIRAPQTVDANTAMPDVGVSAVDARDIAAFLYTLDR